VPGLERERKQLREVEESLQTPPSSLNMDRHGSAARSGRIVVYGPVRGRAGITRAYQRAGGPLVLRALAFATADTVGYIIGAYSSSSGAPDIGKFILALRRERGGAWRIAADMDNGNSGR